MKEEQIIEAARELFYKYGFKKVSMDEIAREAKVTKRTVYMYFQSKEELLKYFIQEELQQMKKIIEDIEKKELNFFESVHQVIYQELKYKKQSKFLELLIKEAEILKNPILIENMKVIDEQIQKYILDKLKNAMEKGYIEVEHPEITAFLIFKMYIALMIDWIDTKEDIDEEIVVDTIFKILKNGLEKK